MTSVTSVFDIFCVSIWFGIDIYRYVWVKIHLLPLPRRVEKNMAPAERRYDPADGATYTYDEAFTYYRSMNLGK